MSKAQASMKKGYGNPQDDDEERFQNGGCALGVGIALLKRRECWRLTSPCSKTLYHLFKVINSTKIESVKTDKESPQTKKSNSGQKPKDVNRRTYRDNTIKGLRRDPWVAQQFSACLWPRARSWRPGIESHVGLPVHGACFSLCLCLCLSLCVWLS